MFENILSKGSIGKAKIKNRFVMPPMGSGKGGYDGTLTDNLISYYEERAKGGYGLIIVEFAAVDPLGKALPDQLLISDDSFINRFKDLTSRLHAHGSTAFLQIHHAGRQTMSAVTGSKPLAPSAVACPTMPELPKELTTKEIYDLIEKYGDAARRAKEAGFDGVELHGAHGYLIGQFLSPNSNKRIDEFGGDLFSRAKFAVKIIKNIKDKCGDYPVCVRLSSDEKMHGGIHVEETAVVAKLLEEAGANAIHVSLGAYGSLEWTIAPASIPYGFNLPDIRIIKRALKIPVIAVGRFVDPSFADKTILNGSADFISFGRGSLADAHMPNKLASGYADEVCQCVGCMTRCVGIKAMETDHGVSCMVNPFAGFEDSLYISHAERQKKVVVVGGGPAGLECAWISAAKGHKVTLFEKNKTLGGQFIPAAVSPGKHDIINCIKFYSKMCNKYNVNIKLNTEADETAILAENPDIVILATGAVPIECNVSGDIPSVTAVDVLNGVAETGQNVLIVGGGLVGLETAEYLAMLNKTITIIEMQDEVGKDMYYATKMFTMQALNNKGVKIMTNTKLENIESDSVKCVNVGNMIDLKGFNTIVWASGMQSYNPLEETLKGKVQELIVIGDALSPRNGVIAIDEGARTALAL